ncbi:MAG: FxLYD domain-containing protein [Methanobacterium sp.]|nr:FxLYD domain-containing protein [Methanobacterium sp.]
MVYCPKCGKKFLETPESCDFCGEIFQEENRFNKGIKIFDTIGVILAVISLILAYYLRNNKNTTLLEVLFILIFFIIMFMFLSKRVRGYVQSLFIRLWFKGQKTKQCPQCENLVSDDKFCFSCGYKLENVKGYYKLGGRFNPVYVELNKNYIRMFKTYSTRYETHRLEPIEYKISDIKDPEINWCEARLFTSPCLKFSYDLKEIILPYHPRMKPVLEELFPNLISTEVGGLINWFINQNKTKITILITIFLILVVGLNYYFTAKTELSLISTSSEIPNLEVTNSSAYRMVYGPNNIIITGNVKNNGKKVLKYVQVYCVGYDSAGEIVNQHSTYLNLYKDSNSGEILKPGETAYFEAHVDDYNHQIVKYKVIVYQDTFWMENS